jgi:hypothetical protein
MIAFKIVLTDVVFIHKRAIQVPGSLYLLNISYDTETQKHICPNLFSLYIHRVFWKIQINSNENSKRKFIISTQSVMCSTSLHFLLQCPSLLKERWEIINNINEINKYFKSLDNRSKLVWLMSTEDSTIIKKTGRLLLDLHTKRNLLLKKNKVIRK